MLVGQLDQLNALLSRPRTHRRALAPRRFAHNVLAPHDGEVGQTQRELLGAAAFTELARRPGWSFALSAGAIVGLFTTLFVDLFPQVMPSSTSAAFDLTIANSSSSTYTLTVMSVVPVVLVPVVVSYQAWTYWVFRKRVSPEDFDLTKRNPLDLIRDGNADAPAS